MDELSSLWCRAVTTERQDPYRRASIPMELEAWRSGVVAESEAGFETLGDVLKKVGSYHWRHSLYGETRPPWKSDTRCAVLERDVSSEEPPSFAQAHSLRRMLSVQQVQDIVENARMQLPAPTLEQLVEAFNYYFARDAFLELAPFPEE